MTILSLAVVALSTARFATGQDDDPFGSAPEKKTKAASAKEPEATKVDRDRAEPEQLRRRRIHPVILALQDNPPKTAAQIMRAMKLTAEISRAEEFNKYAQLWLDQKPPAEEFLRAYDDLGAPFFFELARRSDLAPLGREVAEQVLQAGDAARQDRASLSAAADQLRASATHRQGLARLAQGSTTAVVVLWERLAATDDEQQRSIYRDALVNLGAVSIEPSLAALQARQDYLRIDAARVLGRLRAEKSILPLLAMASGGDVPTVAAAAREALKHFDSGLPAPERVGAYLEKRMNGLWHGDLPGAVDHENFVTLWRWNDKKQTVEPRKFHVDDARVVAANDLATQLLNFESISPSTQRQCLLVRFEAEKFMGGLSRALSPKSLAWKQATELGAPAVEEVLMLAVKQERFAAGIAAVEFLGATGRADILYRPHGVDAPLVHALRVPDQRLQLAAVKAVLQLAPPNSYPGSSQVLDTMKFLISSAGQRRALVVHPRAEEGERIVALFNEIGFAADYARDGRELMLIARDNADYEAIFLSDTLDRPRVGETLQMVRHDVRTRNVPVALMVTDANYDRGAKLAARDDQRVLLTAPAHGGDTLQWQLAKLAALAPRRAASAEVRLDQALEVLNLLASIATDPERSRVYDWSRLNEPLARALYVETLEPPAAQLLSLIGSAQAQVTLAKYASLPGASIEQRVVAAERFAEAVNKRGLGISQEQIRELQRADVLFNADSPEGTPADKQVTRLLLDAIRRGLRNQEDTTTIQE